MIKAISKAVLIGSFALSAQAAPSKKIAANKSPMKFAQAEEIDPVDAEVDAANAEQARGSSMTTRPSMKSRSEYMQKGFGLGAFYQQIGMQSSIHYELKSPRENGMMKSNSKSDKDMKFAGLTLRYGEAPLQGAGYDASLSWGRLTNQSDIIKNTQNVDDTTIVRGQLNAVFAKQTGRESAVYGLVGGSLQQFFGNGWETLILPGIGIQGGGGYAFARNMNIDLVYFFNSQRLSDRFVRDIEKNNNDVSSAKVDQNLSSVVTQGVFARATFSF